MDARHTALNASLEHGLAYLTTAQRADGDFDSFSSPSAKRFVKERTYHTTFGPALILAALSAVPTVSSRRIRRPLARFVAKQRSPLGSFNYWAKNSPERQRQPYPDDLDDTVCALIGLALHDRSALGPDTLAELVRLLLATETQPSGPYRTWLVPSGAAAGWQDVDLAVNANIAYLLSLAGQSLAGLTGFLEQAIREDRLSSPYYPSSYPIIYYLVRAYDGPLTSTMQRAAQHLGRASTTQTALDQALLLTTLLRLGQGESAALKPLADQLLAAQQTDGSWAAAAFCIDPVQAAVSYYNGSESLTTAFALEALHLYSQQDRLTAGSVSTIEQARRLNRRQKTLDDKILRRVERECRQLAPDLQQTTTKFLRQIVQSGSGAEIVSLGTWFNQSLTQSLPQAQPLLTQLGTANLYGWAAYTLFDDFLDDEGRVDHLPAAITTLRYALAGFEQVLPDDPAFQQLVRRTFDIIDGANAWEVNHCRFEQAGRHIVIESLPDYGDVADQAHRSLGHSLAPLAVLRASGTELQAKLFGGVRQAMIHYLTARQLNDDAHDWQADLQKGHITYVVAQILDGADIKAGRHNVTSLMKRCQQQFWYQTLPKICRLIQQQTALSRRSLHGLDELQTHNTLTELLDAIDASVAETLATQSDAELFLKHFKTGVAEVPVA